jgi:NADPH2 dehydrogenase
MSSSISSLFQPLPVGAINVQHRVVMAPLTRFRADKDHIHGELAKTYYEQRASVPGTLIISEGHFHRPSSRRIRKRSRYLERRADCWMETSS